MQRHQAEASEQPFFIYLPFHEPHEPVESPAELIAMYRPVTQNEDQAQYFANVHNVDLAVGRVVEALEHLQLRERTLIVFTSDNGPETLNRYRSANRSWGITGPLRGMKLHTHDGGFHVVGIMSWPGTIAAGRTESTPVSALDLLPTFAELAGCSVPAERHLDGVSLAGFLKGTSGPPERNQPLTWAYYNGINDARVAMRHQQWKVLARLDRGTHPRLQNLTPASKQRLAEAELTDFEIYNLVEDRGETTNLFGRGSAPDQELIQLLQREYRALLNDSPAWQPVSGGTND
jgi:arylsulfatase A